MIITSCRDFINRHSSRQLCCYPRDACLHFQAMKSHRLLLWHSPQFDIKMGCAKLDSLHNTNWISDRAWLILYRPDIVWLNVEKSDRQTSQVSTYTVCKQVKLSSYRSWVVAAGGCGQDTGSCRSEWIRLQTCRGGSSEGSAVQRCMTVAHCTLKT